jgi:hypothetical protein
MILQIGDLVETLAGRRVGVSLFRYRGRDMYMGAHTLDKLRQSPSSVEELAFDLKRKPFEIRILINALLREGSIVKLDTHREGGPFYAPAGYVKPADRLDNSDLVLGREYSGQYEAPIWRDDA